MQVVFSKGDDQLARVFVGTLEDGSKIEFVESVQPPRPLEDKWVLIVSTLKGCPVGCPICDAGGEYRGKLTALEILQQIDYLIKRRFPGKTVPVSALKIQFARMGEPAFNDAVTEVLELLPDLYDTPCLMPSISTVAPVGRERFFEKIIQIKNEYYSGGRFQMQFSIHTTDDEARRKLIPIKTMSLEQMAAWGEKFFEPGDRKITLNFAMAKGYPVVPSRLTKVFSPDRFIIKLTPINPTESAMASGLDSLIDPGDKEGCSEAVELFKRHGYETILSIGELDENEIGSNCGMYISRS